MYLVSIRYRCTDTTRNCCQVTKVLCDAVGGRRGKVSKRSQSQCTSQMSESNCQIAIILPCPSKTSGTLRERQAGVNQRSLRVLRYLLELWSPQLDRPLLGRISNVYEPGSKLVVLGMVIPPFNRNPYNGYINPYYWVDDHPLLYGNNGSLDPGTYGVYSIIDVDATLNKDSLYVAINSLYINSLTELCFELVNTCTEYFQVPVPRDRNVP